MKIFDTHAHYHFADFDADRKSSLDRARAAGVAYFLNVGTDLESSRASLNFAHAEPDFYAAAGLHPNDALKYSDELMASIEALLADPKMIAIGEVGLDYYRDHAPRDIQIRVFQKFLDLQKRVPKPLILHCRDAHEALLEVLQAHSKPPYEGIMHCYSSGKDMMFRLLDLGFHISFAATLTYKKNNELREACKACPADRIMFETDAPFLPPQSKRGMRNESGFMSETLAVAASQRGITPEEMAAASTANALRLFRL